MKKIISIAAAVMLVSGAALADTKTVYYPESACAEIVSQEFSSGGGDTMWHYLEILCRNEQGVYTGFVARWGSAAGALGFGRIAVPDQFNYVPYDGNQLRVE